DPVAGGEPPGVNRGPTTGAAVFRRGRTDADRCSIEERLTICALVGVRLDTLAFRRGETAGEVGQHGLFSQAGARLHLLTLNRANEVVSCATRKTIPGDRVGS